MNMRATKTILRRAADLIMSSIHLEYKAGEAFQGQSNPACPRVSGTHRGFYALQVGAKFPAQSSKLIAVLTQQRIR